MFGSRDLINTTLLDVLADGEFHSGEELGAALGVSRAAVWKQLQKLEELQLTLESQKGKGYRLCGGLDLLAADRLSSALPADMRGLAHRLTILPQTESTNADAAQRILAGNSHGVCIAAEQQTAGRGRRGRQWLSPFAKNLYFSVIWEFSSGAAALEGLSLCVGVAVARALKHLGAESPSLKWPNDVLLNGRKVAGILLEMQGDPAGICQVIIGIGLNVRMGEADVSTIDQPWTDLAAAGVSAGRNEVLAAVLAELYQALTCYSEQGFAPFHAEWEALDAYRDREVVVILGDNRVAGRACGVEKNGGLVVETSSGRRVFHGGEVSLRPG